MCLKLNYSKEVLKITTANLQCLQALFCLYCTIRIVASLTKFQLVDKNGYLDSHFLNSSRNDCVMILSFAGVLVALYGFYKKRYHYLVGYFAVNVACVILILVGNILALFLDENTLNMSDLFCITIITAFHSLFAAVALNFYRTVCIRRIQTGNLNPIFRIDENKGVELEEFITNDSARIKFPGFFYPDYSWFTNSHSAHYDFMEDRNQYLKKILKRGP